MDLIILIVFLNFFADGLFEGRPNQLLVISLDGFQWDYLKRTPRLCSFSITKI